MWFMKLQSPVEAIQFALDGSNVEEMARFCPYENFSAETRTFGSRFLIPSPGGRVWINRGDWLCRQMVNGYWDYWAVRDDIFRQTYSPVPPQPEEKAS